VKNKQILITGGCGFPEKLIPLIIYNILNEKSLPTYGKGTKHDLVSIMHFMRQ